MGSEMVTMWNAVMSGLGNRIPVLLGALAVLVLGWLIALLVRAAVRKGLSLVNLNVRFKQLTGQTVDIEKAVGVGLFWFVLLFTLTAVLNSLDLGLVSAPFAALLTKLLEYLPRLLAGLILALLAWLLGSVVRKIVTKVLAKTTLDEKLSEHAGMAPISDALSQALFWLIILLFVPAILSALQMEGLLEPFREMVAKVLAVVPNVIAAVVIGGVGWILATVLRNLTTNLLRTAGSDKLGQQVGLSEAVKISNAVGLVVFIAVFLPALVAALDALKIEAVSKPAMDMLKMFFESVPHIIAAGLILVITWIIASFASRLLATMLNTIGFDNLPQHAGLTNIFKKTSASIFVGRVILFFAMLFATVEAANQLGFRHVSDLIDTFIRFGGDVLLGSVILVIGFWLATLAYDAIDRTSGQNSKGLARIGRVAIMALVLALGLRAMGVADDIVNLAFGLTLGSVAVAVALSFGLGGREAAGKLAEYWLEKLRSNDKKT
ncbi:MAG: mechanosensitive ion channel [Syntrophaceae bacterium]|nr:mechanosensitive ion channel [Syntrophaceae bacterium]